MHTIGWPLDTATYGGSFLYHLDKDRVALGFVTGLDYDDPMFSPFEAFQQLKNHPIVKPLLEGGTILSAGARAIVDGGYQSLPKCEMPGAMLIGDTAGLLNVPKIKGTHQAIRSACSPPNTSSRPARPHGWDAKLRASPVMAELKKVRNIRPGFNKGLWFGLANAGWETITARPLAVDVEEPRRLVVAEAKSTNTNRRKRDYVERTLPPRDRLADVYFAATEHDEDQPVHLHVADTNICITRCAEEYGNPCTRFCPAGVYEIVERRRRQAPADQRRQLRALQDLRHQGSVPDHRLGDAGRRQRAELPESLSLFSCSRVATMSHADRDHAGLPRMDGWPS